jgi:hypothetical protein
MINAFTLYNLCFIISLTAYLYFTIHNQRTALYIGLVVFLKSLSLLVFMISSFQPTQFPSLGPNEKFLFP